ncbi:3-hydroxyisobutyrate dehydrogenase [Arachidicoccus rhizosphaerae]|uniref:3-hydroxyisobutyrate dehydrogenase n=1 Tax=Arachidicoccus rhizosphaerae TaxID=551991 RepID=A0A1H3YE75_9BACT|nr:NAD(P)-dependent oxidoreductase [Arachidicoccus rhizosphaerae]SEA09919.1 3-hydroxyisobutyrate dehydrogenase [Arachidicoccus rhizosphaerae]
MQTEKLGFIGLGNMGLPMAKHLEKAAYPLSVYNRTKEKAEEFKGKAVIADSIKELVGTADVIFTMLTNDQAVRAVYDEIAAENIQGKLFVDMSTISRAISLEVNQALKAKGGAFLDAPVAGSTGPARDGTLIIMVGGEDKDLQRALPYLEKMGKSIQHLGENGKGLAAKIAVNYFLSTLYASLAETILLADQLGVNRKEMLEIINMSASGSGATKAKTPLLIDDHYPPAFALDLMLKDILLAKEAGAGFPIGKATLETYNKAQQAGLGKEDVIGVIQYLRKLKK